MTYEEYARIMESLRPIDLPQVDTRVGIDNEWVQSCVALTIAELLAKIATGDHLKAFDRELREWFLAQGELHVKDAILHIEMLRIEAEAKFGDWKAQGDGHHS